MRHPKLNRTVFVCLLLHSHFYGKGEASLLSLTCCWCSLSLGYKMKLSETAACHSAPGDPFWAFSHLVCRRHLALLRPPNNIILRIGQLKQIFWTFVRKKKTIPFFCSKVFVLFRKFQASCLLLGGEQRSLLPSHKRPDGVFPAKKAFAY